MIILVNFYWFWYCFLLFFWKILLLLMLLLLSDCLFNIFTCIYLSGEKECNRKPATYERPCLLYPNQGQNKIIKKNAKLHVCLMPLKSVWKDYINYAFTDFLVTRFKNFSYLFWTDSGRAPKIERSSLSGEDRVVLASTGTYQPNGITVDYGAQRWADEKTKQIWKCTIKFVKKVIAVMIIWLA